MTDALDPRPRPALLDRPQPLGFLPTRWFWSDRANWRLVSWMFAALVAVVVPLVAILSPSPWVAGALAAGSILLAQGLLERYVRNKALERRRLSQAAERQLIRAGEEV